MNEKDAYTETIYFLEGRLALAKARAEEAHRVWRNSEGAPGTLAKWTDALAKQVTLETTLENLRDINAGLFGTVGA